MAVPGTAGLVNALQGLEISIVCVMHMNMAVLGTVKRVVLPIERGIWNALAMRSTMAVHGTVDRANQSTSDFLLNNEGNYNIYQSH
jgi:hypothetical protein